MPRKLTNDPRQVALFGDEQTATRDVEPRIVVPTTYLAPLPKWRVTKRRKVQQWLFPELAPRPNVRHIEAHGKRLSVYEWAERIGTTPQAIYKRVERGYSPEACVAPHRPSRRAGTALGIPKGHPGAMSWYTDEWDDDDACWYVVQHHPDGITLEQIASLMACSLANVQRIEQTAIAKMQLGLQIVELGGRRADWILTNLRGKPLSVYERVVRTMRERVKSADGGED